MASASDIWFVAIDGVCDGLAEIKNLPFSSRPAVYCPLALILLMISPIVSPFSTFKVNEFCPS